MAFTACEPLELGLITHLVSDKGPRAFELLRRWQEVNRIGDSPGPFSGAGVQWTEYAAGHLGYMWALTAALFDDVPGARAWCAAQPAALLKCLYGTDWAVVPLLALWVMHISAGVAGCDAMYERARERLRMSGGVTKHWLITPEPGAPPADGGDWESVFATAQDGLCPEPDELISLVCEDDATPGDPFMLALDALIEEPAMRPTDGAALVAYLARRTAAGRPSLRA